MPVFPFWNARMIVLKVKREGGIVVVQGAKMKIENPKQYTNVKPETVGNFMENRSSLEFLVLIPPLVRKCAITRGGIRTLLKNN